MWYVPYMASFWQPIFSQGLAVSCCQCATVNAQLRAHLLLIPLALHFSISIYNQPALQSGVLQRPILQQGHVQVPEEQGSSIRHSKQSFPATTLASCPPCSLTPLRFLGN